MNWPFLYSVLRKPSSLSTAHLLRFFSNKSGVVIGGRLRWNFRSLADAARETITVDNYDPESEGSSDVHHVTDADNLFFAEDESLDFVCSSHVTEHIANPLKAIAEWKRVIKKGGVIYVGVPDKRHTFDHKRSRTPLSHLIDDYEKGVDQTDKTHVAEFIEKWDNKKSDCNVRQQALEPARDCPESWVHHHVWIVDDLQEIFEHMGLRIVYGPVLHHDTIHIIGQKSEQ